MVVISLPQPDDLTSLVLRMDFTDDTAWEALKTALHTWEGYDSATFVSDPRYAGVSLLELVDADISINLTIANMDFAEFADAADESGTYRGFEGD